MTHMALRGLDYSEEFVARRPWTARDSREVAIFCAQCSAIVGGAIALYAAGPVAGSLLALAGLAAWAGLRRPAAPAEEQGE